MRRSYLLLSLLALGLLPACDKLGLGSSSSEEGAEEAPSGAVATGSAAAKAASKGPSVTIPAGTFKAGGPCGATPRITNEELVAAPIALGEFSMDEYPYPNDPAQPARVNVTRDEAQSLCAADGKRLCTELEWERVCKGPSETTFEYGAGYSATNCKTQADLMPGKRPACASGFGAKDMHGLVYEWTQSAWGRGTSGDLGAVRGGGVGLMQSRCANGQSRAPTASEKDLGFRCCSGPMNAAEVDLPANKRTPMEAEPSVETNLAAAMLRVMPSDHRSVAGTDVAFDRVFRWHPRDHEELLIGRWTGTPKDGSSPYHELAVFKVCGSAPSLIARMTGPVDVLGNPGAGSDLQRASSTVSTGDDKGSVELRYQYGSVKVEQPAWIKAGNTVSTGKKPTLIRMPIRKK